MPTTPRSKKRRPATRRPAELTDKELLADAWRELRGTRRVTRREVVINALRAIQRSIRGSLRTVWNVHPGRPGGPVPPRLLRRRAHRLPRTRCHGHRGRGDRRGHRHPHAQHLPPVLPGAPRPVLVTGPSERRAVLVVDRELLSVERRPERQRVHRRVPLSEANEDHERRTSVLSVCCSQIPPVRTL